MIGFTGALKVYLALEPVPNQRSLSRMLLR